MYLRRMNFEICLLALQHIMIASILDYFAKIVEFELTEDDSITGQFRRIREPKFSENDLKIDDDASAAEILRQIFQILLRYDCASAFFEAATTSPKLFHCRQCIENVDSAVDDG